MPSESGERRPTKPGAPPAEPEHLPCPRCDSSNTKFCYYNNYNFSQPRHFCKACRRYWTHGGTLRDVPVGGGSRKNAKRSRPTTSSTIFAGAGQDYGHMAASATPIFLPLAVGDHGGAGQFLGDVKQGSFTSLLNPQGAGLLTLGGFGLGMGNGFEGMGFSGLGRAVWPFHGVEDGGVTGGGAGGGSVMGNTWQLESGDCFSLPNLAISTPGHTMK